MLPYGTLSLFGPPLQGSGMWTFDLPFSARFKFARNGVITFRARLASIVHPKGVLVVRFLHSDVKRLELIPCREPSPHTELQLRHLDDWALPVACTRFQSAR